MTYQEIVSQVIHLPARQRLELIETLTRSLREEIVVPQHTTPTTEQRLAAMERISRIAMTTGSVPTDEALSDERLPWPSR